MSPIDCKMHQDARCKSYWYLQGVEAVLSALRFDPVRLRLSWHAGNPPDVERCKLCSAYREAHVLHRIDEKALYALLGEDDTNSKSLLESIRWEGKSLPCGLLDTQLLQRQVVERLSAYLTEKEMKRCSPMQLCCTALLLAVDSLMQDDHSSIQMGKLAASNQILQRYRQQLARTNGTVLLSKHRYRQLRRIALEEGLDTEQALLLGGPELPGRIYSDEVYFALSPARCQELESWRHRHAERLALAARVRSAVAHVYDLRHAAHRRGEGTLQLKVLVQPGHAQFVREASELVDEGFMISIDYGADADALVWHALVHPNHEGIHIMDARQATSQCAGSYLACPGLQDITMTVDFTEAAGAGRVAGWKTAAYAPIFHLEFAYDQWLPRPVASLLERAGGPRTVGLHAWYRHSNEDAWSSFKVLVLHRGSLGSNWTLGAPDLSWTLQAPPRFAEAPFPCWKTDMTKPAMAALISHKARSTAPEALEKSFREWLGDLRVLQEAVDQQYSWQRQSYRDLHLAQILTDLFLFFARGQVLSDQGVKDCVMPAAHVGRAWLEEVRMLATSRRLPEMHGDVMFNRVFGALAQYVHGNATNPKAEPYECIVPAMIHSFCRQAVA